jgi:hypothetical protein
MNELGRVGFRRIRLGQRQVPLCQAALRGWLSSNQPGRTTTRPERQEEPAVKVDDADFRRTTIGMPESHALSFKSVAADQKCVIIVRAPGPTCRQLLEQGYDTKGFRIHAKSCDWGPMAGFVLRDPRLNKRGAAGAQYNADEHKESFSDRKNGAGWVADTVPLKLYEERIAWLRTQGLITVKVNGAWNRFDGEVKQHEVSFHYSLRKEFSTAGVVWGVYIEDTNFKQVGGTGKEGDPLLAMTNPRHHRSWPDDDFRNAVTGDYDLFSVWPYVANYDHHGEDRRVLGTAQNWTQRHHIEHKLERNFTVEHKFTADRQGTKLGNVTNRIYMICQLLNSMIGQSSVDKWGPFPQRMVCWHSDETTRPFVNDVDLPILAFSPSRHEYGIETIQDFREFIQMCEDDKIRVILGEGWTLPPDDKKPNRLGPTYARLVPEWMEGPWKAPDWYNR